MLYDRVLLNHISPKIPNRAIYRRLGYHCKAEPDTQTEERVNRVLAEAVSLMDPRGIYRSCDISVEDNRVIIDETAAFSSSALSNVFKKSTKMSIIAVSIGPDICERIADCMHTRQAYADGVILDAVASELCEACAEALNTMVTGMAAQQGYRTTFRFSPGYKDFALSGQQIIDRLIGLQNIGVTVTDHFLLKPEKSVTALIGWERTYE
ncbi:MAG: vitamin B12 dependent-methionine synthase activation domain-containing protein [Candidatus Auribacterota bacterium]